MRLKRGSSRRPSRSWSCSSPVAVVPTGFHNSFEAVESDILLAGAGQAASDVEGGGGFLVLCRPSLTKRQKRSSRPVGGRRSHTCATLLARASIPNLKFVRADSKPIRASRVILHATVENCVSRSWCALVAQINTDQICRTVCAFTHLRWNSYKLNNFR